MIKVAETAGFRSHSPVKGLWFVQAVFFFYCSDPQNQDLIWKEQINTFTVLENELSQSNISQIGPNKHDPSKHSRCEKGGRTKAGDPHVDCGFKRDLFLSAGKDLALSTQSPNACLNTFRGYPIHQLYICSDIIQTWLEFLKTNPAMFHVTASRASVCLCLSPDVSCYEDICLVKALKALKLLIPAHTACLLMTGWILRPIRWSPNFKNTLPVRLHK